MKKIHIVLLLMLVVAIGVVVSTFADSSTYEDFTTADAYPGKEFHIIGKLNTEKPINFDPKQPDQFSFYMFDSKGLEKKVVYYDAKPQDFEKTEQVVIVGKSDGNQIIASSLLLKCPSKYNDEDVPESFKNQEYEAVEKMKR